MFTEFSYSKSEPFAQFTGWHLVFLLEASGSRECLTRGPRYLVDSARVARARAAPAARAPRAPRSNPL
ncbi:hypothetical protein EVAR_62174_1 [Eumeta japonica]|uniref:Uncharacterized protein n=1 Tax=Eumeta variegata TaxID=151549 RepID=A0A4C1ZSR7_EUMVA|nr:hypothetical protein EVAR_62174_1 [Eumeta japonica]